MDVDAALARQPDPFFALATVHIHYTVDYMADGVKHRRKGVVGYTDCSAAASALGIYSLQYQKRQATDVRKRAKYPDGLISVDHGTLGTPTIDRDISNDIRRETKITGIITIDSKTKTLQAKFIPNSRERKATAK